MELVRWTVSLGLCLSRPGAHHATAWEELSSRAAHAPSELVMRCHRAPCQERRLRLFESGSLDPDFNPVCGTLPGAFNLFSLSLKIIRLKAVLFKHRDRT